jgi:hypothetical protein
VTRRTTAPSQVPRRGMIACPSWSPDAKEFVVSDAQDPWAKAWARAHDERVEDAPRRAAVRAAFQVARSSKGKPAEQVCSGTSARARHARHRGRHTSRA